MLDLALLLQLAQFRDGIEDLLVALAPHLALLARSKAVFGADRRIRERSFWLSRHDRAHRRANKLDVVEVHGVEISGMHALEAALDALADCLWRVVELGRVRAVSANLGDLLVCTRAGRQMRRRDGDGCTQDGPVSQSGGDERADGMTY